MSQSKKTGSADHLKTNVGKKNNINQNHFTMKNLKSNDPMGQIKNEPIKSFYADFWHWFQNNEKSFFNVVKNYKERDIKKDFFDKLSSKLIEFKTENKSFTATSLFEAVDKPMKVRTVDELFLLQIQQLKTEKRTGYALLI